MMEQTSNPSTSEAEAEEKPQVQDQPNLHSESSPIFIVSSPVTSGDPVLKQQQKMSCTYSPGSGGSEGPDAEIREYCKSRSVRAT